MRIISSEREFSSFRAGCCLGEEVRCFETPYVNYIFANTGDLTCAYCHTNSVVIRQKYDCIAALSSYSILQYAYCSNTHA